MVIARVDWGTVQKAISLYGVGTNMHDLLISKNYIFLDSYHPTILSDSQPKRSITNCLNLNFKTCFAVLLIFNTWTEKKKRT